MIVDVDGTQRCCTGCKVAQVKQGGGPFFAQVPVSLMKEEWTDAYHVSIYTALRATADFGEAGESVSGCYEKMGVLADMAGCSRRTFHDRVSDLREHGWVDWKSGREDGGRNEYVVHFTSASDAQGCARDADLGVHETHTLPTENHNTENQNQDTNWEEMDREKQLEASSPDQPCPIISEVFNHCREVRAEITDKKGGPPLQLTKKRHGKIRARLREGWQVEQLQCAYEGMANNDYHQNNGYLDPELAFRDDEKVRRHMKYYADQKESKDGGSKGVQYWD